MKRNPLAVSAWRGEKKKKKFLRETKQNVEKTFSNFRRSNDDDDDDDQAVKGRAVRAARKGAGCVDQSSCAYEKTNDAVTAQHRLVNEWRNTSSGRNLKIIIYDYCAYRRLVRNRRRRRRHSLRYNTYNMCVENALWPSRNVLLPLFIFSDKTY